MWSFVSFVVEFQGGVRRLLNGRTYDELPIAAAVQRSAWRTETTSNDKQRGHPDGALFCLAEFASLLSLRLLHPPGQNRAWLGTPNLHPTARSARWGPRASTPPHEARVGDPGPTACGIALMFRLPRPYPSSRFARLGNGPGLTSSAPNGAGFSRRLSLRGYRLLFLREYTKEHKVRLPFRQIRIRYFCCRQNGPASGEHFLKFPA